MTKRITARQRAIIRVASRVQDDPATYFSTDEAIEYAMAWVRVDHGSHGVGDYLYQLASDFTATRHNRFVADVEAELASRPAPASDIVGYLNEGR